MVEDVVGAITTSILVFQCLIENEMLVRNRATDSLAVKNVPLFNVLKQMESQFDINLEPPANEMYRPHPGSAQDSLFAYTGILFL